MFPFFLCTLFCASVRVVVMSLYKDVNEHQNETAGFDLKNCFILRIAQIQMLHINWFKGRIPSRSPIWSITRSVKLLTETQFSCAHKRITAVEQTFFPFLLKNTVRHFLETFPEVKSLRIAIRTHTWTHRVIDDVTNLGKQLTKYKVRKQKTLCASA